MAVKIKDRSRKGVLNRAANRGNFASKNIAAQYIAEYESAKLVTNISEETLSAIQAIVLRSFREGIKPDEAAVLIREAIGLSTPAAQAAANYRAQLILMNTAASRLESLLSRYTDRKLAERALIIARTESMNALNIGAEVGWLQAQKDGLLEETAEKVWLSTKDEVTCPICRPMQGQRAPIGENFILEGPPGHTACRCTVGLARK